jgi:3-carboxy-cis,cis-muconate cycloisomerase
MRANLDLTGGLITAEAVMMELGALIGRQQAHHAVHTAARQVALSSGQVTFADALNATPEVAAHLHPDQVTVLLDPTRHAGLSVQLARTTSRRAAAAAERHRRSNQPDRPQRA